MQPREASYVAETIRAFLDGSGGERERDDFTSCSLSDARLDCIRRRAAAVPLPVEPDLSTLEQLAREAEELAQGRCLLPTDCGHCNAGAQAPKP